MHQTTKKSLIELRLEDDKPKFFGHEKPIRIAMVGKPVVIKKQPRISKQLFVDEYIGVHLADLAKEIVYDQGPDSANGFAYINTPEYRAGNIEMQVQYFFINEKDISIAMQTFQGLGRSLNMEVDQLRHVVFK